MLALATWLALAPQPSVATQDAPSAAPQDTRPASAATEEAPPPKSHRGRSYHLDVEAQTNFPVDIGARITAEFPHRIQLSTSLGGMPGGYVDVVNAVVVAADGYDDTDAEIVRSALQRSLVWRTHLGWRILKRRGLYVQAGYGLVTLGGSATGGDVLALITGDGSLSGTGDDLVDLESTLHMLDLEVGWQFLLLQNNSRSEPPLDSRAPSGRARRPPCATGCVGRCSRQRSRAQRRSQRSISTTSTRGTCSRPCSPSAWATESSDSI